MKLALALLVVLVSLPQADAQERRCRPGMCPDRPGPNRPGPGPIRPDRPRPDRPGPVTPGPIRPRPDRPDPRPVPGPIRPDRPRPDRPIPGPIRPDRPRPDRPAPGPIHPRPRRDRYDDSWSWRVHDRVGHRPVYGRGNVTYTYYRHAPYRNIHDHTIRYSRPYDFYRTLRYRDIYFNRWVRIGIGWSDGYYYHNGYPYFVYNGYMHRYSRYDVCDYHLVDGVSNYTVQSFYGLSCAEAYDRCADLRDAYNSNDYSYRYFCSEEVAQGPGYDYNWDYNDDFYYDVNDDYYYDNDPYRY